MKLLLTSGGLTNKSIANALLDLVSKPAEEISLAFIPTAANPMDGDKNWLIDNLKEFQKQDYKAIDIVDISALPQNIWQPRLEMADVLFFSGGSNFHLMEWLNKSGLAEILPDLLKTKVYAGISAGSMITNKTVDLKIAQLVYGEDLDRTKDLPGLNYVDFYFFPHLNDEYFKKVREENIGELSKSMKEVIYALDDQSALAVVDGKVQVVSEGKYLVFNQKAES